MAAVAAAPLSTPTKGEVVARITWLFAESIDLTIREQRRNSAAPAVALTQIGRYSAALISSWGAIDAGYTDASELAGNSSPWSSGGSHSGDLKVSDYRWTSNHKW